MRRLSGFWAFTAFLVLLPILFPDNYYVTVVGGTALMNAILAVGLNLLMGYAGQISLGHAAFFGIGAYSSAILTGRYDWNAWGAMAAGFALTGLLAYLVARPILRLKGHYLAMATLGLGIIVHIVLVQTEGLTGGPDGLSDIPGLSLFGWAVDTDLRWYTVMAAALLLVLWLALNIIASRSGRALRALHGSEVAAEIESLVSLDTRDDTRVRDLGQLVRKAAGLFPGDATWAPNDVDRLVDELKRNRWMRSLLEDGRETRQAKSRWPVLGFTSTNGRSFRFGRKV